MTSLTSVARLVPVIAHAVAVFGDEQKATLWLSTPLGILEGRTPAELLASEEGIERVEQNPILLRDASAAGIAVFNRIPEAEAVSLAAADPVVAAGALTVEAHRWWCAAHVFPRLR